MMRKFKSLALILVYTATLLAACAPEGVELTLTPLEKIADNYTLEKAKADHSVVYEDLDITSGQEVWDRFMDETTKGESASVRLAFYYTPQAQLKGDKPMLYVNDLSYDGEKYTIASVEDGNLQTKEYKQLVKYEGTPTSQTATYSAYTYFVLVNDATVTWEDIEHGVLSSRWGDQIDHYQVYSDLIMK